MIKNKHLTHYDRYLLFSVIALLVIGLLMVTSASMAVSTHQFHHAFHYFFRQLFYVVLGLGVDLIALKLKIEFWEKTSLFWLGLSVLLLILVLIPGIGKQINGSSRWIGLGSLTLQPSEFLKLSVIIYLAYYLSQYYSEVIQEWSGLIKPLGLLAFVAVLLLMEPDFGTVAVIGITTLMMLYLAGIKLSQFGFLMGIMGGGLGLLAIMAPYRLLRLTSFLDPWHNAYNSGYQLAQSLIAFGRGGLWGVGLGGSIQKLFYLPQAHTDFLLAILGEELGLVGIIVLIGLYLVLVFRAFAIGRRAMKSDQPTAGLMAYGIGTWLGLQAFINMGVSSGLLPTKGLTLPLISYGGSSLVIILLAIAILFRIDYEAQY